MCRLTKESGLDALDNQPFKELHFKDFVKNEALGIGLPVIIVVKDQDRLAKSRRSIETLLEKRKFNGRSGFRDFLNGFCYTTELNANLQIPDKNTWLKELPEPRSVLFVKNDIILTAANAIHIFDTKSKNEIIIKNPYFGCLHTSTPNIDNTKLLISSPGFDSLLEYDLDSKKETWRWTAWEHDYNRAANGNYITLDAERASRLRESGNEVTLVDDSFKKEGFGIPTTFRTTHVNGAIYDYDSNFILATFYHEGTVVRIDRHSGQSNIVIRNLKHPHGIQKDNGGYMVTDTSHGIWYQMDKDFNIKTKLDFTDFPGKSKGMEDIEWVQYVTPLSNELYIAADANRQSAWVIDLKKQEYNQIVTNTNWSVQVILPIDLKGIEALASWKDKP